MTRRFKILRSLRFWILVAVIVSLTFFHQASFMVPSALQAIFDILPYIPIILGALWFGLAGGIVSALLTSTCFALHLWLHHGGDFFGADLNRTLNILMYNVVGLVTGYLAREQLRTLARYRETAEELRESYAALREKTEALIENEKKLAQANRLSALGELAAGLAHEIGNPLGTVKGAAEILADGVDPTHRRGKFAELLLKEVDRLDAVVRRFLAYARPHAEGDEQASSEELGLVASEMVDLTRPECERGNVDLISEIEEDLPRVACDSDELRQVFLNLLLNASQATPAGGQIRICARRVGGEVLCAVKDSGHGIPREVQERIFDPFFTTKDRGTGLGLAITHRIVTGCGGRIEVESEMGEGTEIRVYFPVSQHEPAAEVSPHR